MQSIAHADPHPPTSYSQKLRLLLEMFPRSDGRAWRGADIERETDGVVSQSYFSQLRNGKYDNPGLYQLAALADAIRFPFDLWLLEPYQWDDLLRHQKKRAWESLDHRRYELLTHTYALSEAELDTLVQLVRHWTHDKS